MPDGEDELPDAKARGSADRRRGEVGARPVEEREIQAPARLEDPCGVRAAVDARHPQRLTGPRDHVVICHHRVAMPDHPGGTGRSPPADAHDAGPEPLEDIRGEAERGPEVRARLEDRAHRERPGLWPIVISRATSVPPRRTWTATGRPTRSPLRNAWRASPSATGWPPSVTTMSPRRRPPRSAGLSGASSTIKSPASWACPPR